MQITDWVQTDIDFKCGNERWQGETSHSPLD